jgi:RsiW-degrading membrane proteinase PrsW (M82 family)
MINSKAPQERKHVWRDEFLLITSLIVFVGVVYGLDNTLKPVFTTSTLLLTGVFLALVPAAIWLVFFYMQDRVEPEPKHFVLGIFGLGALLASAVGIPLVENIFRTSHWLYADTLTTILGGILVVGFTQEFLKYAAVRFSIYHSDEFDEPTDGVIYATAAGLGYATVLNIQFVVSNSCRRVQRAVQLVARSCCSDRDIPERLVFKRMAGAGFCGSDRIRHRGYGLVARTP